MPSGDRLNHWASMNPNSEHQLWSEWRFEIWDNGLHPSLTEVTDNARRWLNRGFGSVGQMKVDEKVHTWRITAIVEGVAANDPLFVKGVRRQFQQNFVEPGWGPLAVSSVEARILAGDEGKSRPPAQLVVMPMIIGG